MISLGVVIPLLSTGCLVTEDIQFEGQENVPPSFVFRPRSMPQIGETLRVDSDVLLEQGITNLTFQLQVRDDNVQQPLETQIRLRTLESPAFRELLVIDEDGVTIPGTGSAVRDHEFSFGTTLLKDGHCHQLQLAVSGSFPDVPDEDRVFALAAPVTDVAIATWWLWETSADTSAPVNLETCPTDDF